MSKPSSASNPNIMNRARGPMGFSGPVVKAKDRKGTIKRIWLYMEKQKAQLVASIFFCHHLYAAGNSRSLSDRNNHGRIHHTEGHRRNDQTSSYPCACLHRNRGIYLAANVYDGSRIAANDSKFAPGFI